MAEDRKQYAAQQRCFNCGRTGHRFFDYDKCPANNRTAYEKALRDLKDH